MVSSTHDIEGTEFMDEVPLERFSARLSSFRSPKVNGKRSCQKILKKLSRKSSVRLGSHSHASDFMTGNIMYFDGGYTAG